MSESDNKTPDEVGCYTARYFLTAGQCDAKGQLPLPLLASQYIDVASLHANALGIGYEALLTHGIGWVLSRLTIEMDRWPGINADYNISTWIEAVNRHLSERCAVVTDRRTGQTLGHIRSTWAAIDYERRCAADLSKLGVDNFPISTRICPVAPQQRLRQLEGPLTLDATYRFRYCDTDFNKHVNSARYIELLLNELGCEYLEFRSLRRFEICYVHEAYCDQEARVQMVEKGMCVEALITVADHLVVSARLFFENE